MSENAPTNTNISEVRWLSVPEVAERCGVSLSDVRGWLKERVLVAVRRGENSALSVPEVFLAEGEPRPDLLGTVTVLFDGGMTDDEVVRWLLEPDDSYTGGSPMACLQAGHKTEVRRRAMELAW